jgi:uncharacterized protein
VSERTVSEWLGVFLRAPQLGRVKTRLARAVGDDEALAIYRRLVQRTVRVAQECGAQVLFFYAVDDAHEDHWDRARVKNWLEGEGNGKTVEVVAQVTGDLGEKMRSAVELMISEKKAERVILIGTDAWHLTSAHVREAFSALQDHELVFGPARDGGYYLLGLTKLMPEVFSGIPWSTDQTLAVTLDRAQQAERRVAPLLERLIDVDEIADWQAVQE